MTRKPGALEGLFEHLRTDRVARYFLAMRDRYRDLHMKDLVAEELDDHRQIRIGGHTAVNFGSDSFLGLDRDPRVIGALAEGARKWGAHNGSSRAFCSVAICNEAERRLAEWLEVEDTLIYPSVTLANIGAIPAVTSPGDLLVVDRLAHDSVHQGSRLAACAGAVLEQLDPCSPVALQALLRARNGRHAVVAVDGVYSMTGIVPPLAELDRVAREFSSVMYIDDAHGTGVIGERGRGAAHRALGGLRDVVCAGSLSKAFSCLGGYVTCTPDLKLMLKMKSSTYIFFGGPVPPPYLEAIIVVCDILCSEEYLSLARRLHDLVGRFASGAESLDIPVLGGESPIISVPLGDAGLTLSIGKWLFEHGYYVQSAVFPAVPFSKALLRIQINANHTPAAVDGLLNALGDVKKAIAMPSASALGKLAS